MRARESNYVAENKEQVALKVEQLRGNQSLGLGEKDQPSKFVYRNLNLPLVILQSDHLC
jgi:hypothetical protein